MSRRGGRVRERERDPFRSLCHSRDRRHGKTVRQTRASASTVASARRSKNEESRERRRLSAEVVVGWFVRYLLAWWDEKSLR